MSVRYIRPETKLRLWGKAAGRCEYRGCNRPLWIDQLTKAEFNTSYIAHIVADSADGPRGHPTRSIELKSALSNLMLLCDEHHRLIDVADVIGHSVVRLTTMKLEHEERIERVSGAQQDRSSEVLLFSANVASQTPVVNFDMARLAMLPSWYPSHSRPTTLGFMNAAHEDRTPAYWQTESTQLRTAYVRTLRPRLQDGSIRHLSVFAIAPQPLLILLGSLLGDIVPAEVYQLHREPPGWGWPTPSQALPALNTSYPQRVYPIAALVVALSGRVDDSRIRAVLGDEASIYRVTVAEPHNDMLKATSQLGELRREFRRLLDHVKSIHGQGTLHVFPAAPVSACIELGRVLMPKADMTLRVYDENKSAGGFVHALDVNTPAGEKEG
jgi:hypothetical protein